MDSFVGCIHLFAFEFAPRYYAKCDGQLLSIAQNVALFSILGTTYGGDGKVTFALPDLRGRVPVHPDATHPLGLPAGAASVTLGRPHLPAHVHALGATASEGTTDSPVGNAPAAGGAYGGTPDVSLHADALQQVGGGQPLNVEQPYATLNFCIALYGIYPPRP